MITNTQVSSGYQLITSTPNGCTITWDIDDTHTSNLNKNKLINNSSEDVKVKVFATIKYGTTESEEVAYEITIEAKSSENDFDGYYDSLLGVSDSSLKSALKTLMENTHTTYITYGDARYLFVETDPADDDGNIILFYSRKIVSGEWDSGETYNREHVWPKSLSNELYTSTSNSYKGPGSDMHMLRPEDSKINSSRGNKTFGTSADCYEPIDEVKGDVARILFYMSVHYDLDIEGTKVASSIAMLLEWHELDPVDDREIARNNVVQDKQGNRNPFIDYPEFAERIWG